MKITRLVPWFGANAANAGRPAQLLDGCGWVYIPFAGSMCEVPHFPASTQLLVSDVHDDLINLAQVVSERLSAGDLANRLDGMLFHPKTLEDALLVLKNARGKSRGLFGHEQGQCVYTHTAVAAAYFVVAWMGRSGVAGTRGEERVRLALRYDGGGGDPVTRYRSAVESIGAWSAALRRCSFSRADCFEVLARLAKKPAESRIGIYCDPPWPDDGDSYLHVFTHEQQQRLARELAELPHRVVMRFGDHPLIRELYPESRWAWEFVDGRDQHNAGKGEVFLVKLDR